MSPRMHTPTSFDARVPDLILAISIPSIAFIMSILGAYAWTAWNPVSRPYLNRVSFRLLVYALIANLAYAVTMISNSQLKAGAACNGTTFLADVCLEFAGAMFFSMALNLQLVLVHGVNGQKMEKYYISGAILLTLACNVPPYAAGALGFWDYNDTCWFNSPDPAVQLRWFVSTQALWMFLMAAGEVVSFLVVLWFMIFRPRATCVMSSMSSSSSQPSLPKSPFVVYRKIILRIGLYPLFSCFLTITGATLDLHTILDPVNTQVNWILGIIDLLIYTLRPLMYATLAATDPSFLRALRALYPRPEASADSNRVRVALESNARSSGSTCQNRDMEADLKRAQTDLEPVSEFTRQI
ncbi:hypothetical protein K438DRAFT_1973142 [Mycena galopus ATCC 62051]|nr:hypothetical protein K438DRAFT_1973142 [Mycena galopus ATCC 62051]